MKITRKNIINNCVCRKQRECSQIKQNMFSKLGINFKVFENDIYQKHIDSNKYVFLEKHPSCLDFFNPNAKTFGSIIEGDGLVAMFLLQNIYKGKIDLIYTVPPYNSKTMGFMYSQQYQFSVNWNGLTHIDKNDNFKHSKWLSMMQIRLEQCKDLLSNHGLIAISVDDNEMPYLKLLMDKIFGSDCYKGTIVWNKTTGMWTNTNILKVHEYVLIYEKLADQSNFYFEFKEFVTELPLIYSGSTTNKKNNSNWYYVTYNDQKIWPINSKGEKQIWALTKDEFQSEKENANIIFKKTSKGNWMPWRKHTQSKGVSRLKSVEKFSGGEGTKNLKKDLDQTNFLYRPKPVQFLKHLFKNMSPKNGLILDFFAGSGTTACAVAELNKEDGGKRQFVLIENHDWGNLDRTKKDPSKRQQLNNDSEHKICPFHKVMYARLEKNQKKYDISCKTFLINDLELAKLDGDETFLFQQEKYIQTCTNLLSILNPAKKEYTKEEIKNNNYQFEINGLHYGFFEDDLDVNMRFDFAIKKEPED